MNTLAISNTLIGAGFNREQANTLAEIVKSENLEKRIIRIEIMNSVILVAGGATFGYVISLLNTIIDILPSV
jgi:hypothetical protein